MEAKWSWIVKSIVKLYFPGCHPFEQSCLERRTGRILYPWYEVTCRIKIGTGHKLPDPDLERAAFGPFLI